MELIQLFSTPDYEDGTAYSFVGVDPGTGKCYTAINIMIHGYGGGYGAKQQITKEISLEQVREYAKNALESRTGLPAYIEPFVNITQEELDKICSKNKKLYCH